MSDTKALNQVIQFAKRHGANVISLSVALQAAAELSQIEADLAEARTLIHVAEIIIGHDTAKHGNSVATVEWNRDRIAFLTRMKEKK